MKILAIEKEVKGVTRAQLEPRLKAEAARVWELCQSGTIREIYFRKDLHNAVIVLECESLVEAEKVLSSLPLVKERLIAFDIMQLLPYDGFSRLFP